jgi:glycosyltransferase involved in cell wall biosynthesis
LAVVLSEKQHVKVITPEPSRPLGFDFRMRQGHQTKFEHHILKSFTCPKSTFLGRMRESFSFGLHAARYIKAHHTSIDCVYVLAWPLFAQFLIVRAARKFSIPAVTHVMDLYPESLANKLPVIKQVVNTLLLPIDKYILQNSSVVITISANMRDRVVKTRQLESEKVEIVHTWQNDDLFFNFTQPAYSLADKSLFTFMFLGCLSKSAALEVVIHAFKISNLKNARLVIAGNGSEKDFLESFSRKYPDLNIEFWDAPLRNVPEIQDVADVLILSLRRNTAHFAMPSKLPAYMFSKKPVIASVEENSATAKAIQQANCGWTMMPENPEKLAKVFNDVVAIPRNSLQVFGNNGFLFAKENFSKEKNLMRLVSLIHKTL